MKKENAVTPAAAIVGDSQWDGLRRPQLLYAAGATFFGVGLAVLDGSICNVALPEMAQQLGVSESDSIWIVNAFQLITMMTLLPFAALGELIGYRKIFTRGLVIFTVGSALCAVSPNLTLLVCARIFQGVGASMLMSINTSLIKIIYPRRHLSKGMGFNATVIALAFVVGPTVASAILAVAPWPWLFAVNIPLGVVLYFISRRHLPDNPTRVVGRKFSYRSAALNAATFGLFIGCIEAYSHGADALITVTGILLLFIIGFIFVRDQLRLQYPMLPFDLLRIPIFSASVITSILSYTAQMLGMVAMPFMLYHTFGCNASETGLLMTAWPVVIILAAPVAGMLVGRIHAGILGAVGLAIMTVGCFSLAFIPEEAMHADIVWRLMLCGLGFGLFQSPNNSILLSSAPSHRSGSAGGMLATARLVGQTTGAALVALMFHVSETGAANKAMFLAGCCTLAATLVSLSRTALRMPQQ